MGVEDAVVTKKKSPVPFIIIGIVLAVAVIAGVVICIFTFSFGSDKSGVKEQIRLGDKYFAEMDYPNAILAYDKALEIDPNNVDAYQGEAKAYKAWIVPAVSAKDYRRADDLLDAAIVVMEAGVEHTDNPEIEKYLEDFRDMKAQLSEVIKAEEGEEGSTEEETAGELTEEEFFAMLPDGFACTPGENWGTMLLLNDDGTFRGDYQNYDFSGERAYEVHQVSSFTGRLTNVKKVDDFTYSVEVADLKYEQEVGTSFSETDSYGLRITEYVEARGIAGPGPLLVYLKGADLSTLPESFLKYIDYDASTGKLPCYGLYNPDGEGYGFEGKYTGENADG